MASDQGLLQTIIEQPDDDTLRLIYADWLEDQASWRSPTLVPLWGEKPEHGTH